MPNRNSEQILRDMETRERQSRTVGWIIVAIIIGSLLWLVFQNERINQNLTQQLDVDHTQVVAGQKATHDTLEAISNQGDRQSAELRCVADLFISPKARAGKLTITDFDNCTTADIATQPNATTPPSSASPAPVSSTPAKNPAPANNSTVSTPPAQPSPTPTPKPKTPVQQVRDFFTGVLNSIGL